MPNDIDASEITPGMAVAAAQLLREGDAEGLRVLSDSVDSEVFAASCLQLALMVIDWISLSHIGDEIALAYETDDSEALDSLYRRGARFEIQEDGTMDSWIEHPSNETPDFPIDFWTQFTSAVQQNASDAADTAGIGLDVIAHLSAGMVNDGVIGLLTGNSNVAIPSAAKFYKTNQALSNYAVVVASAFVAYTIINEAALSRTESLSRVLENGDVVTYEEVVSVVIDSIHSEILE